MTKYDDDSDNIFSTTPEYMEVNVNIIKVTEKAILISDGYAEHWVPKSLCYNPDEAEQALEDNPDGEPEVVLHLEDWFVEKEGIYYYL